MTVIVALPMPPSINSAYGNKKPGQPGKGRYKTKALTDWVRDATAMLRLQKPGRTKGDVKVEYLFGPRNKNADVCNREKVLSDFLVSAGIIEDDRFIVEAVIKWDDTVRGACATVRAA